MDNIHYHKINFIIPTLQLRINKLIGYIKYLFEFKLFLPYL